MATSEFPEFGEDVPSKDDDDDVDDRSHKKLLNAVSSLYRKQRIAAPKRSEPSLQISEFNLTKTERKRKLAPTELLKGLGNKATHQKIQNKVKDVRRKLKPLPKPLEKFEAEKITRESGYENVIQEVSKWEATIQKNRAADMLIFPLRGTERIRMEPQRDILGTFSKPTELELKMAEVLNKSPVIQELKEEAQAEKLTLAQLIQRRNMIAKMRHRESYRIAKAVRQNKIKSKKYHRMLKRDKIKNELKEFELLQKTDPAAALAKLEKVERARAEERISLRHRNTGKWARGLAIRAKYDAEARAELADNLRKSRELTEKVKASMVSDSDDDDNEDDADDAMVSAENEKSTNPWVSSENEVASFVSGYRKFWQEQNKAKSQTESGSVGQKAAAKTVNVAESVGASGINLEESVGARSIGVEESVGGSGSGSEDGDKSSPAMDSEEPNDEGIDLSDLSEDGSDANLLQKKHKELNADKKKIQNNGSNEAQQRISKPQKVGKKLSKTENRRVAVARKIRGKMLKKKKLPPKSKILVKARKSAGKPKSK